MRLAIIVKIIALAHFVHFHQGEIGINHRRLGSVEKGS